MDLSFLWISAQHAKILSLANKSLQYIPITDWLAPNTQLGHRITQILIILNVNFQCLPIFPIQRHGWYSSVILET